MLRISKIVLPLAWEPLVDGAALHATFLARRFGAELHLVSWGRSGEEAADLAGLRVPTVSEVVSRLGLARRREENRTIRTVTVQLAAQNATHALKSYVADNDIDLVVMGRIGRHGDDRVQSGKATERIIRELPCPVLTIRCARRPKKRQVANRRILLPTDFSEHGREAFRYAIELAIAYEAEIDVLHVVPISGVLVRPDLAANEIRNWAESAWAGLKTLTRGADNVVPVEHHVKIGHPTEEIVAFADERTVDLIILPTHGRTGASRLLFGSVTEEVVHRTQCPVFIVRSWRKSILTEEERADREIRADRRVSTAVHPTRPSGGAS
jgi:nucleotide-binding universal stress UspA family protein